MNNTKVIDIAAKACAKYISSEPQQVPKPIVAWMKKTPVADYIRKRYQVDTFAFKAFDGINLVGTRFRSVKGCNWDGKNHVMLLNHGFGVQQLVMWMILPFFLPQGYDCVTIDLRNSGLSDKAICTMGYNEAKDVAEACNWIRKEYGDDVVLGLYGQSMGSVSILNYAPNDPDLSFIVEDCGFASLENLVRGFHSQALKFLDWDPFWAKILEVGDLDGATYDRNRPVDAVAKIPAELPILFLHSIPDTTIFVSNVDELYEAKQGEKELHKYTKAPHSLSWAFHPKLYYNDIDAFLKKYGFHK